MMTTNFRIPDLKKLYSTPFDAKMIEWRRLGAIEKSKNILAIVERYKKEVQTVLEVGCGNGAVLDEINKNNVDWKIFGIEIGEDKLESSSIHTDCAVITTYDGKRIPFDDDHFDFVFATHVLEHVVEPRTFLLEMRRVSRRFIYVEVPCELNLTSSRQKMQTSLSIGHINSFTPNSFCIMLETSGLMVIDMNISDWGYQQYKFNSSAVKAIYKLLLRRAVLAVNENFASKIFTYHCGALCQKGQTLII